MPPGLPTGVIARPRLDRLFEERLRDHESLALLAAAGSGKTVQAQMFATGRGCRLSWLTLDEGDRSPSRLLLYLAEALAPFVADAPAIVEHAFERSVMHEETVAALAEAISIPDLLIVLDQCELIVDSPAACSVLETLLDYLPITARALVLGRVELPISLGRLLLHGRLARITDGDLALTAEEAAELLRARGEDEEAVEQRWRAARGWVAGVAFGRAGVQSRGSQDDFYSYLGSEILDRATPDQRRFLLDTSILTGVSMRAAAALSGPQARAIWRSVALMHLPATTSADRAIVYHPCFREYLRDQLELNEPERLLTLQQRHARLLIDSGQNEEAVELLLSLGLPDQAIEPAGAAALGVAERGDWELLLRWVDLLGYDRISAHPALLAAYIRALRGARRLAEARNLALQLDVTDRLREVVAADPGVTAHIAWSMLWQPEMALDLLVRYDGDLHTAGIRYMLQATAEAEPAEMPSGRVWTETERHLSWGLMVQGRLSELVAMIPNEAHWPPSSPYTTPHPLLGLVWRGEIIRARELFDQVAVHMQHQTNIDFWCHVEAWILMAEGEARSALAAAERAILHSRRTNFGFEPVFQIAQAQALLMLDRVDDAIEALNKSLAVSSQAGLLAYVEWAEMLLGRALLLQGDDASAAAYLSRSVDGMRRAERLLHLPTAAVYLAEAERRLGDCTAATVAADLAYEAAARMGTYRTLQLALQDCPALFRKLLEADPAKWRRIGAGLRVTAPARTPRSSSPTIRAVIDPFGPSPDIIVDGVANNVRRVKLLELAWLVSSQPEGFRREQAPLLLFPESDQRRGGNHFRQVVHQLRKMTGLTLVRLPSGHVTWSEELDVVSKDVMFERAVAESRSLAGEARLQRLRDAFPLVTGPFLPASDLEWVTSRRFALDLLLEECEAEAAELSAEIGDHCFARQCAESILARDPFSDAAYRVLLGVELAAGTESAALGVYRRALVARQEIRLGPDPVMTAMMEGRRSGSSGR